MSDPNSRKKLQPYPFPGSMDLNGTPAPFEVLYLETSGALVRLEKNLVKVGDYHQCRFEIPVSHHWVTVTARVFKTYDRSVNYKEHVVERIAELHFEDLTADSRNAIASFLAAIRQR